MAFLTRIAPLPAVPRRSRHWLSDSWRLSLDTWLQTARESREASEAGCSHSAPDMGSGSRLPGTIRRLGIGLASWDTGAAPRAVWSRQGPHRTAAAVVRPGLEFVCPRGRLCMRGYGPRACGDPGRATGRKLPIRSLSALESAKYCMRARSSPGMPPTVFRNAAFPCGVSIPSRSVTHVGIPIRFGDTLQHLFESLWTCAGQDSAVFVYVGGASSWLSDTRAGRLPRWCSWRLGVPSKTLTPVARPSGVDTGGWRGTRSGNRTRSVP